MQLLELDAHLHAQRGVEIGQRLVEQKYLRIAHDGAAERNALALTTGQMRGLRCNRFSMPRMSAASCTRRSISGDRSLRIFKPNAMLS